MRNNHGSALIIVMSMTLLAVVGFAAIASITSMQATQTDRQHDQRQALLLAEAAVNKAKLELVGNTYNSPINNENTSYTLNNGQYYFQTENDSYNQLATQGTVIVGYGAVPSFQDPNTVRIVKVGVEPELTQLPAIFSDAIHAGRNIDVNGNPHTINGDIFAGNTIDCVPDCGGVTGNQVQANDLGYQVPLLDFDALKFEAIAQGNYFGPGDIDNGGYPIGVPTTFWNIPPGNGNNATPGVPNIVFIEADIALGGNEEIGGFVVVVGDYLSNADWANNPQYAGNIELNGRSSIDGVAYMTGDLVKNAGGVVQNVDGGVIAWRDVILNGQLRVRYNQDYMDALQNLDLRTGKLVEIFWNEFPKPQGTALETWWSAIYQQIGN